MNVWRINIDAKALTEDNFKHLIICPGCGQTHTVCPIQDGADACCSSCGLVQYRSDSQLLDRGLAINITALVFLVIASAFPIIDIEIFGSHQFLSIPKSIYFLFDKGFYLVGITVAFLVLIVPIFSSLVEIYVLLLLKFSVNENLSRRLLILLSKLQPWGMSEIFLVSILIALIKLIDYVQIDFGPSFWALIVYAMTNLYNLRVIHLRELWSTWDKVFGLQAQV